MKGNPCLDVTLTAAYPVMVTFTVGAASKTEVLNPLSATIPDPLDPFEVKDQIIDPSVTCVIYEFVNKVD